MRKYLSEHETPAYFLLIKLHFLKQALDEFSPIFERAAFFMLFDVDQLDRGLRYQGEWRTCYFLLRLLKIPSQWCSHPDQSRDKEGRPVTDDDDFYDA